MKKIYFVIILALLSLSFSVIKTAQNNNFVKIYQDKDCIIYMKREDGKKAWIKWEMFPKTVTNKKGKKVKVAGKSMMELWDCQCDSQKYSILKTIIYNNNGDVLNQFEDSAYNEYVVPNTIGEKIFNWICMTLPYYDDNY